MLLFIQFDIHLQSAVRVYTMRRSLSLARTHSVMCMPDKMSKMFIGSNEVPLTELSMYHYIEMILRTNSFHFEIQSKFYYSFSTNQIACDIFTHLSIWFRKCNRIKLHSIFGRKLNSIATNHSRLTNYLLHSAEMFWFIQNVLWTHSLTCIFVSLSLSHFQIGL